MKLLQRNPTKRLGSGKGDAEEIKCHPFFKGINWIDVEKKYKIEFIFTKISRKLKPPLPEIRFKFNPAIKGENLKEEKRNDSLENNYVSGWSFICPNNKT